MKKKRSKYFSQAFGKSETRRKDVGEEGEERRGKKKKLIQRMFHDFYRHLCYGVPHVHTAPLFQPQK